MKKNLKRFKARKSGTRGGGMMLALAVIATAGGADVPIALGGPTRAGYGLLTPDQQSVETAALAISRSPEFNEARRRVIDLFKADQASATPDGWATENEAIDETLFAAALDAAADDPYHPRIFWTLNAPHRWADTNVPGSRYGIDNPDNIYRQVFIDGASHYKIKGQHEGIDPAQFTFELLDSAPGVNGPGKQLGILKDQDIQIAADGSFTLEIGPEAAAGRKNYLQSGPDAKVLLVRDSLSDWVFQTPNALRIQRLDANTPASPTPHEQALKAAELAPGFASYWLHFRSHELPHGFYHDQINTLAKVDPRQGRWGYVGGGRFKLASDEALIITVSPLKAAYMGFQLADPWGISTDYIHRTGSLNKTQATPNADGSVTYVIAATDPGFDNWLDTGGLHNGFYQVRWQQVPSSEDGLDAVKSSHLVKLADLDRYLPGGVRRLSPGGRAAQLSSRLAAYNHRIAP